MVHVASMTGCDCTGQELVTLAGLMMLALPPVVYSDDLSASLIDTRYAATPNAILPWTSFYSEVAAFQAGLDNDDARYPTTSSSWPRSWNGVSFSGVSVIYVSRLLPHVPACCMQNSRTLLAICLSSPCSSYLSQGNWVEADSLYSFALAK